MSLRKFIAALLTTSALACASAASAAVSLVGSAALGSGGATAAVSSQSAILTNTSPALIADFVVAGAGSRSLNNPTSCTDSAATPNTYAALVTIFTDATSNSTSRLFTSYLTSPLPAPCTVTASMAVANTLVITANGTCGNITLTAGQAVVGTSITAGTVLASNCTISGGTATCTTTGDAGTPGSETVTISSVITCSWGVSTSLNRFVGAAAFRGMAATAQFDAAVSAHGNSATNPSVTTGTLNFAAGGTQAVLIGIDMWNTTGAETEDAAWNTLTNTALNSTMHMAYKIVSATTAVTRAPTIASQPPWLVGVADFKGLGSSVTPLPSKMMTGMGQ